jgi:two-component system, chemotaxis family, chemotaxis protein CheY
MPSGETKRVVGTVLMVDDSTSIRQALSHHLQQAGFRVTTAAEGVEGLWRARQDAFDLVVTDVHMPAMGGLEFLAELRKIPAYTSTPVFVLTSDYSSERLAKARQLGVTVWLKKPVDVEELVFNARHVLDARRLSAEVP